VNENQPTSPAGSLREIFCGGTINALASFVVDVVCKLAKNLKI
jgi:hypothetical protein